MFKKSGTQLRSAPDIPALQQLLNKCFSQPGEKLQVYWRTAENQLFILDLIYILKDRTPHWQLISEKSGRRVLLSDYKGHDILLVYKQLSTAINNAMDGRAGEENSRISRTRDARAAAANWLENKSEDEKTPANPANPDFWQDGVQVHQTSQGPSALAAAIDESPWSNQPTVLPEASGSFGHQAPSNAWAKSSNSDWTKYDTKQGKGKASDMEKTQPNAAAPAQPVATPRSSSKSKGYQPPPPPPAKIDPVPEPEPVKKAPAVKPAIPAPQGRPQQPAAITKSQNIEKPEPAKPAAPAAPVKVTSSAPQASPPNPLMSNLAPRYQNNSTPSAKERSMAYLENSATTGDAQPNKKETVERQKPQPKRISENPELLESALPTGGDLTDTTVPKLFKQFKAARVTGRLDFVDDDTEAIVFLDEGKPVEAWMGELKGDYALLELLLWTTGRYTLSIGVTATNRNVKGSPEELVQHNANIASLLDELAGEGLTATSTFAPVNAQLSSDDFNSMATPDAPMELEKLAKLYVKLDGKKTIADLNALHVLPRPVLVQAIHHLYFNNVIDIVNPLQKRKDNAVAPKAIDGSAIQSVMMSLRRMDTGLFIYPAFLYFLQEEFFRVYRAKGSMSVILFEMRELVPVDGIVRRVSLSSDAIADATLRISRCKRHTDLVAHYEQNDFAIILPNTASGGTKVFANKIIKALSETPLTGTEGKKLSFSFGSASMPEDFKDLSMLLGAAELAMNTARQRGKPLILFKDVEV